MGPYLIRVHIGGTFIDCVVLDRAGNIPATTAASTPGNFTGGMLAAMQVAAERLDLPFDPFRDFGKKVFRRQPGRWFS